MNLPFYEQKSRDFSTFLIEDQFFPLHLHSHIEFTYIKKGKKNVYIDGNKYELNEGDCILMFPNVIHKYEKMPDRGLTILGIYPLFFSGNMQHTLTDYHAENPVIRKEQLHPDALFAINALCRERYTKNENLCAAYLQVLLAQILPIIKLVKNSENFHLSLAQEAISYLSNQYQNPININQVAGHLGVNRFKLSRMFSGQLNTTFTHYLQELRIEHAKEELLSTDISIVNVAFNCGFENQRTFNRDFRELVGITPSEYRKQGRMNPNI